MSFIVTWMTDVWISFDATWWISFDTVVIALLPRGVSQQPPSLMIKEDVTKPVNTIPLENRY